MKSAEQAKATRVVLASDVPDSHKIAVYNALCTHFANEIDADPYFATSEDIPPEDVDNVAAETECVGIAPVYSEGGKLTGLSVLADIRGWADNESFQVQVPTLSHHDRTDSGTELAVIHK